MLTLSNKVYDVIKWLITIGLPAVGALYFIIIKVWDFERIPGVNGIINTIIVTVGVYLRYSSKKYSKKENASDGDLIVVTEENGGKFLGLGINKSLEDMTSKDTVKLNVVEKPPN